MNSTKFLKVLGIATALVVVLSCRKDSISISTPPKSTNEFANVNNWSRSEALFFELNRSASGVLNTRGAAIPWYHPILKKVYNKLVYENERNPFVDSLVAKIGLPAWERTYIYESQDSSNQMVIMPFSRLDSDTTTALLTFNIIKVTAAERFVVSGFTREALADTSSGNPFQKLELLNWLFAYERNFFDISPDPKLIAACCEYSKQTHGEDPENEPSEPPCTWRIIEICHLDGFEWFGGQAVPIHLDHDRDGILNQDDQDWYELTNRYNITQSEFEQLVFEWWDEYFYDDYGEYDDF